MSDIKYGNEYRSEIRDSVIRGLLDKVKKQNYGNYLVSVRLERIRQFRGAQVNFDFPVTALIGPNGSGKSTILSASMCIYSLFSPTTIFKKSRIGDESMDDWKIEYETIERIANDKGTVRSEVVFKNNEWSRSHGFTRNVRVFSIRRTVPVNEKPNIPLRKKLTSTENFGNDVLIETKEVGNIDYIKREAERILGRSLENFKLIEVTLNTRRKIIQKRKTVSREILPDGSIVTIKRNIDPIEKITTNTAKTVIYIGNNGTDNYSEFNFGSGEASVIHMVADIERQVDGSLILIEEIENGLHPLAVRRMVDYLIDVANRKGIQVIFTTHSDYAISPLPSEAIWASIDGRLQQGKLSVEALRAVSGRVDKKLVIFVEDEFAKAWVEMIAREKAGDSFEEIGIYAVSGDGNAVTTHIGQTKNPAILVHSLCFIDGDSKQKDDPGKGINRLPGGAPESTVFNAVVKNLNDNIALLTAGFQCGLDKQQKVKEIILEVSHTNRDPHLLFSQIGIRLGFVSEEIIRGAFLALWIQENTIEANVIAESINAVLRFQPKQFQR